VVAAAALLFCAVIDLKGPSQLALAVPQLLAGGAGIFLLLGLWTPVVGTVIAVLEVWIVLLRPVDLPAPILLATVGGTLAVIGPGAWSFDARLFGRKHITIHERE
jgi:putative oxidoreductase